MKEMKGKRGKETGRGGQREGHSFTLHCHSIRGTDKQATGFLAYERNKELLVSVATSRGVKTTSIVLGFRIGQRRVRQTCREKLVETRAKIAQSQFVLLA